MNLDIDWKASYLQNHITDFYQTRWFAKNNIRELNPIWRPIYKDESKLALGWLIEAALANHTGKHKELTLWRIVVVGLNSRNHRIGMPIISFRF